MTVYIYELTCPISLQPKYIGKSKNPTDRLRQHSHVKNKLKLTRKEAWVKNLKLKGVKPILTILEEVDSASCDFLECYYISLYKSWGFLLKNMTNGGDGNSNISEETKKNMRGLRPAISGSKNPFYGKKHSDVSLQKMKLPRYEGFKEKASNTLKEIMKLNPSLGYQKGAKNISAKQVCCYSKEDILIKTYDCMADTALDGFSPDCISKCVRGINKEHKGYLWKLP